MINPSASSGFDRHDVYGRDYFERGPIVGVSGYMNYSWMPELTIKMAHKFILELPILKNQSVLDFGCAKGFLVKALRLLDIQAFGVDVSEYAINNSDSESSPYLQLISGVEDPDLFLRPYDWVVAKDVLEHLSESEVDYLLERTFTNANNFFCAVPLAADDTSGRYVVPDYDRDVTHKIAKSLKWWREKFSEHGWRERFVGSAFPGCKENWTDVYKDGNGFLVLEK